MVPAVAPHVTATEFEFLLQLLPELLRGRLQQVLLLGELRKTHKTST